MKLWLVKFTQVSHHRVGALVAAETAEEANEKARDGECSQEFNLTHPESYELKSFSAKEISKEEADEWVKTETERSYEEADS